MNDVLFTAEDVADALRECRTTAYERGVSAGRAEATRMLEFAVRLNGHGPSIVKALQEATEPAAEPEPSRDEIAVLAAIDALIEAKMHGAESGPLYRQIAAMIGDDGEALEGGLADDLPDSEFDPEQLAAGVAVEMEHTDDEEEAAEIAKDHLTEDADYYRKLASIEGETLSKAFDSSKHPRGDDGRFIGRESINAAKSDPALAEKLREKTTDPEERKKLDAALKGESDLGRTKAGLHREKVAAAKREKSDRVARVRDLADEISMARRGGEPVPAEHFRALVADLPHLTIKDLRSVRLKLAASFFGRTKREDLVTALVHQAKMRAEQIEYDARHAEDDPLDFGMDAMTSVADRPSDRRQEDANPWHKLDKMDASNYGPAQHGGRMYQRHTLDREHGVKDTVAYNTHGPDVKPYWLDEGGKPVDVITPTMAKRKEPPPEGTPVATTPPPDQPQGDMPTESPTAVNNPSEGPPTEATPEPVATAPQKPTPPPVVPEPPKVSLSVPKDPKRLTIDQANQALADLGYTDIRRVGGDSGHPDDAGITVVRTPNGEEKELRPIDVKRAIYGDSVLPVATGMDSQSLSTAFTQTGRGKLLGAAKIGDKGKVVSWRVSNPDGGPDMILTDDEVRQAVIDSGLARGKQKGDTTTKSPTAAKPAPKTRKPRKPKVADEQLTKKPSEAVTASQSVAKAASAPSGWVGDDLLLINHAFNHLKATDPAYSEMTLDQFKDQLVRENGKSVKLSRADLPQALDPNDVRESQTQHPAMKGQHGGEFHFIKVPRKKGQ